MKKCTIIFSVLLLLLCINFGVQAQCAMCTKTAQQLGEKPAQGLNSGILYLMFAPFAIVGIIAYKWWKNNRQVETAEINAVQQSSAPQV